MRAIVYIDGFNLYYSIRYTPFRWLNPSALTTHLFPTLDVQRIKYFTAPVKPHQDDAGAKTRQDIYVRALKTLAPHLEIHEGHFIRKKKRMALVLPEDTEERRGLMHEALDDPRILAPGTPKVEVWKTEEKGSDVNLASHLDDGPARVAALSYAWIIMLLPQGIFALSIANAIFPTFSAQVARGEHDEMKRTLASLLRLIAFVTIPASAGLYVLRTPIIQLLLQRGSFGAESTALTADALQFYALGLVPHSMVEILTRAFYALHDTLTPVLLGLLVMGLNVVLSLILIGPMQQGGLALANSLATAIEMVILGAILWRRMGGLDDGLLRMSIVRTALATVVMVVALVGVVLVLPPLPGAMRALVELSVGAIAFFLAALLLGSPELAMLQRLAARFAPRPRPSV